jgi:hypothetical protein
MWRGRPVSVFWYAIEEDLGENFHGEPPKSRIVGQRHLGLLFDEFPATIADTFLA